MADVTFPASVTSIGNGAFDQCKYLFAIIFLGYVPSIADVTGDGAVNIADTAGLYAHVTGTNLLN